MSVHRRSLIAAFAAMAAMSACQRAADLSPRLSTSPAQLELRAARTSGDSTFLVLQLSGDATPVLGSVTASLTAPHTAWTLLECAAVGAEALVACHQDGATVRVAGAWASGARAGALVTFTVLRTGGAGLAGWRLDLTEVHSAFGHSLADSVVARREGPQ